MWLNIRWKIRGFCVFWLFFKIGLRSAISFERSRRELSIDVAEQRPMLKKRKFCVFWLFFKIGLCSAISFERSRREVSIEVTENRSTLKNYQNTHYPRYRYSKQIKHFPKREACFYCVATSLLTFKHAIMKSV